MIPPDVFEVVRSLDTTFTLVHELIHSFYGKGQAASHREMADAARTAMKSLGIEGQMPTDPSDFFDAALLRACGHVKL